jgi:hypothetical protein
LGLWFVIVISISGADPLSPIRLELDEGESCSDELPAIVNVFRERGISATFRCVLEREA